MSRPWQAAFLANLRLSGVIARACDAANVSYAVQAAARKSDADFAAAVADAFEESYDALEAELLNRAVAGLNEPVVYQGGLTYLRDAGGLPDPSTGLYPLLLDERGEPKVLTINKKSDTLLMLALKGRRKAYSTERTELTGADGAPVVIDSSTRAARIADLMATATRRKEMDDLV